MSECNFLCDYKIITIYPVCLYLLFKISKKMFNKLLVVDMCYDKYNIHMYDNTYEYEKTYTQNESDYYNNMLLAFNHIPT